MYSFAGIVEVVPRVSYSLSELSRGLVKIRSDFRCFNRFNSLLATSHFDLLIALWHQQRYWKLDSERVWLQALLHLPISAWDLLQPLRTSTDRRSHPRKL